MPYEIGDQVRCISIDGRTDDSNSWVGTVYASSFPRVDYPRIYYVEKRNGNIVHVLETNLEPARNTEDAVEADMTVTDEVHPDMLANLNEPEQKLLLAVIKAKKDVETSLQNTCNEMAVSRIALRTLHAVVHENRSMSVWAMLVSEIDNQNASSVDAINALREATVWSLFRIEDELIRQSKRKRYQRDRENQT